MIIGVTGKSGSGKTTFCKDKAKDGFTHIDMDKIFYAEVQKNKSKLLKLFGLDKHISKKELGEYLFTHREEYDKAVKLVYPSAMKKIDKICRSHKNILLDHILLPKMEELWNACAIRYLFTCDKDIRLKRIMKRDKITLEYALIRENASIEYDDCDYMFNFKINTTRV